MWKANETCLSLKCGLNLRRVLDLENVPDDISNINPKSRDLRSVKHPDMFGPSPTRNSLKRKRGGNQEEINEVSLFRRVRIYNIEGLILPNPLPSDLGYRAKVCEIRNDAWTDRGSGFVGFRQELKVS